MPGSVAVLSDIHAVLPALEAVLAEPEVRRADTIALTGDIVAGPQPNETMDLLLALGDRALWVRGNADREVVEAAKGFAEPAEGVSAWAGSELADEHVEFLAGLPFSTTAHVDGFGDVLFCHATPRDDEEVVVVDTRLERWAEVYADVPRDVRTVVCGHTHMPFIRLVDGRQVVNPGSVGMPYGRPGAHWALLADGAVTLRRTDFDVDAACERIAAESS